MWRAAVALAFGAVLGACGSAGAAPRSVTLEVRAPASSEVAGANPVEAEVHAAVARIRGKAKRSDVAGEDIDELWTSASHRDLLRMVASTDAVVRLVGAELLVRDWPDDSTRIVGVLNEEPESRALVDALCTKTDRADVRALIVTTAERSPMLEARYGALDCLEKFDPEKALAIADSALDDPDLAAAALTAYVDLHATTRVAEIARLARGSDPATRLLAVQALGALDSPDAVAALRAVGDGPDDDVGTASSARRLWYAHPARARAKRRPEVVKSLLEGRAAAALAALARRDMSALATLVHPTKGITFGFDGSPSGAALPRAAVASLLADPTPHDFGVACGSGEMVRASYDEYLKSVLGAAAFTKGAEIDVGYGNWVAVDGLAEPGYTQQELEWPFPTGEIVEFSNHEGMWMSLTLVFEEDKGKWWLVAAVPNHWCP